MIRSDSGSVESNTKLGDNIVPHPAVFNGLERFVCLLYQNKSQVMNTDELRYYMFCKMRTQLSYLLPPTLIVWQSIFCEPTTRRLIWKSALIAKPSIPTPVGNGLENDRWRADDRLVWQCTSTPSCHGFNHMWLWGEHVRRGNVLVLLIHCNAQVVVNAARVVPISA